MGSLSPILSSSGSPHAPNRSPAGIKRRPASFHARTPRTPRPNDLKVTPFSRMLNTPTSVDSLPRLRRFTPSQTQISSFAYLGHDEGSGESKHAHTKDNKENTKNEKQAVAKASADTPPTKEAAKEKDNERREKKTELKGESKQSKTSQVLSQPVSEIQGTTDSRVRGDPEDRKDLVEVPQSNLKPPESRGQEMAGEGETGEDQKMCCGFFFTVSFSIKFFSSKQTSRFLFFSFYKKNDGDLNMA